MTSDEPPASPQISVDDQQIAELLQWYLHAGVDTALEDRPVDQFEQTRLQVEQRKKNLAKPSLQKDIIRAKQAGAQPANQSGSAAIPDETAIANARSLAKNAKTLDELRQILSDFKGCNLRLSAKSLVFGGGNPDAKIMLVGEAPDRDEDKHGQPFVGRSGQLLDRMLAAIGLSREEVYLTNIIPWRPPGNRAPTPQETEICRPFIERQIELVSPQILVLLGGVSAKILLNTTQNILRLRGSWHECELPNTTLKAMPTLHPSYLLNQPVQKKLAWHDLLKIREHIG